MGGPLPSVLSLLTPPFERRFGLYAGRALHFFLAGLARLRVIVHVPCVLLDDEQSEKLGRELLQCEVCFMGREIMAQDRILLASSVVKRYEFQCALHEVRVTSLVASFPVLCSARPGRPSSLLRRP